MSTMTYKGYAARVEFDNEDGLFVGRVAGLRDGVNFHGASVDDLRTAFREAVDGYIDVCVRIGKTPQRPFSGQLMVRVDPAVHARAALAAELAGMSLAKWAEEALDRAAGSAGG